MAAVDEVKQVSETASEFQDMIVISGMCCTVGSLYLVWPDCIGSIGKFTCCCCMGEQKCCKFGARDMKNDGPEEVLCLCMESKQVCIKPTVCCKGVNQCFCCDTRFALPCDEDVPNIINACGLNCAYNFTPAFMCCAKAKDIMGK